MSNDSDSEDSLLGFNAVPRRKRTETKKISKGFAVLDDALGHADRMFEHDELIHKIKQENAYSDDKDESEDALAKRNEQILADFHKPKIPTTTHGRDSIFVDLENVLSKQRCIDLGKAMDVDLTNPLGVRRTIVFDPTRRRPTAEDATSEAGNTSDTEDSIFYFDRQTSVAPYIAKLKACLRKHSSYRDNSKALQLAIIQPLRKASTAKKSDASQYLELKFSLEQALLAKQRKVHDCLEVPEDIFLWLLRVACSPECIGIGFRYGAFETLRVLLRQNHFFRKRQQKERARRKSYSDNDDGSDTEKQLQRPHFLNLSQFAVQLQSWVMLPIAKTDNTTAADQTQQDDDFLMDKSNSLGLERLLMIWSTAFQSDQVSARQGRLGAIDAQRCLTLLAKALVDASVQDPTRSHLLNDNLKVVISKLLEFVYHTVMNGDEAKLLDWMNETSQAILEDLHSSDLGPGINKDDEEDEEALLTVSLLCRLLPYTCHDTNSRLHGRFQKSAVMFKSIFTMHALHFSFLEDSARGKKHINTDKKWEDQVFSAVTQCQNVFQLDCDLVKEAQESLPWLVICSSLAGMVKLNEHRSNLEDYASLSLAVTEMSLGSCLHAGMELLKGTERKSDYEDDVDAVENSVMKGEYASPEQARIMTHLLSMLKFECTQFMSKSGSLSTFNLLFQRATFFVQSNTKYFADALGGAARAGGERGEAVQTSLKGYFGQQQHSEACDETEISSQSPTKRPRLAMVDERHQPRAVASKS